MSDNILLACCGALVSTAGRLVAPRRPDQRFLANLTNAGLPRARTTVRLTALHQADQSAPTAIVAEGLRKPRRVAMTMATYVIEHPQARFLVDPAMCADIHERVLPEIPQPLRRVVTPDKNVVGLPDALGTVGLDVTDIDFVTPTHLHWDHVGGLLELPAKVPVRTLPVERDTALRSALGFVTGPLAGRDFDTYELDGPPVLTFARSHDVFGDGSVVLVDLAGHTPGSVGVLLALDGGPVLLAGDAVWHGLQARHLREKAPFPGNLVDYDRDLAFAAIHRLHALAPEVTIVASHDRDAAAAFMPALAR
ncbi:MBL fold metallo-hydrolase [Fodinicola acaciae]|uniref:MBL fold metallo-hydrolase n=1 Tax=Fodinicola acaciae TaxID=2681555 RepID=UPI0013D2A286|nr:MBL fold metallo-hydrolase [Fodinicola acaciae]